MGLYRNGTGWIYSQGSIPANEWTHAAVSVATNGSVNFYKNAQLLSTHAGSLGSADDGLINIGRQSPDSCACNLANGQYDEIRIWNSVRSQSQILADFNKSIDGNTTGLLAYWKFNQVSGTSVTDSSSNANHGTVSGTATWVTSTAPVSSPVAHTPITDANFQDAINLWFSDETNATATYGHIRDWNVSAVTDMSSAFKDRASFNEDIGKWDVSSVINMGSMFRNAHTFNQPIGEWDVSSVNNMGSMFRTAGQFNQPIGNWDTSNVNNMAVMFSGAASFNQPIGNWDTDKVTNMKEMFRTATKFNQPIGDWNVSAVTNMDSMFRLALDFNQSIESWDTSSVSNMEQFFSGASDFNQPLNDWNVSSVTKMKDIFKVATSFNQPLGDWDIGKVTNLDDAFQGTHGLSDANKATIHYAFKSNPNWTTDWSSYVGSTPLNDSNFQTAVNLWFSDEANATAIYGHISDWNVSAVTNMAEAFRNRTDFNDDISNWDVSTRWDSMFVCHV